MGQKFNKFAHSAYDVGKKVFNVGKQVYDVGKKVYDAIPDPVKAAVASAAIKGAMKIAGAGFHPIKRLHTKAFAKRCCGGESGGKYGRRGISGGDSSWTPWPGMGGRGGESGGKYGRRGYSGGTQYVRGVNWWPGSSGGKMLPMSFHKAMLNNFRKLGGYLMKVKHHPAARHVLTHVVKPALKMNKGTDAHGMGLIHKQIHLAKIAHQVMKHHRDKGLHRGGALEKQTLDSMLHGVRSAVQIVPLLKQGLKLRGVKGVTPMRGSSLLPLAFLHGIPPY